MVPERPLPAALSDNWRYALLGGVVSIAITLDRYWGGGAGDDIPAVAVFLGALVAGYLAAVSRADTDARTIGVRTGAVGSLPALWLVTAAFVGSFGTAGPMQIAWNVIATTVICGAVVGFASLFGIIGATLGDWLAEKGLINRLPAVGT